MVKRLDKRSSRSGQPAEDDPRPRLDLSLLSEGRVVVVGLGGIGSFLARLLAIFLSWLRDRRVRLVLIDGDSFEERNRERMEVPQGGNKAFVTAGELGRQFGRPGLSIRPVDQYVSAENACELILEKDVVFGCVDRHASRHVLDVRCAELRDVVLISAGNDGIEDGQEGTYGNVQIVRRRNGRFLSPALGTFHPEIRDPADEVPGPACSELVAAGVPQIVFTNHFAASAMGAALWRLLRHGVATPMYDEACFDIAEARMLAHRFGAPEEEGRGEAEGSGKAKA